MILKMEIERKHILIIIFIYILISSLFYLSIDFLPDESNYLFTTKKMLEGHAPYRDYATDVKPPLNYYFLSIFVHTGTDIVQILRLAAIFINAASSYILFLIARKMFDKKIAACSAIIFLFIFTMPSMSGYAMNGDRLSVLFSLASIFYFVNADKRYRLVLSGIFLGIAALAKQTSLVILGFYFLYCLYLLSSDKKLRRHSSRFLITTFSFLIPVFIVAAHFLSIGALSEMITWTTKEAVNLRKDDTWIANPAKFTYLETLYTFSIFSPILLLSLVSFAYILMKYRKGVKQNEILLVMLLIPTLYPFILVFRYMTLLAIPMSILSSIALLEFIKSLREKNNPYLKITASLAIGILFLLSVSLNIYSVYRLHTSFSQYGKDQDRIIEYLANNAEKNQKIYVYGYVPKVYYLSGLDPPKGFYYLYPYKEHVNETEQMRTIEILKENNVRTIVLYRGQNSRDNNPITYSYIVNEYYVNYTVGDFDVMVKK